MVLVALAAFAASPPASAREAPAESASVEVMILATYHFANPGQDMVNMQVDDVLAERRQREIALLAEALAGWQPTKVAVETVSPAPDLALADFAQVDELLATRRNESIQIGYRLADMLGHEAVYGFDERSSGDEPDYFPMGPVMQFAAQSGQQPLLDALLAKVRAQVAQDTADLARQSIARSLVSHNDAAAVDAMHDALYYSLLQVGDAQTQPGAELNAYWYMRNAKMFAKLDMIAQPGDRLLVIVGSGHATWLRHFIERMPGYRLVDATPFLLQAAAKSEPTGD